ncbi:MAG: OmpA/MotB domain-containing protein [Bacteroidetes bacterium]|nr:MAG: OmpA/MotB domain-containing protein [Bacteroidota bacterium]
MKKNKFTIFVIVLITVIAIKQSSGQEFLPFSQSTYSGVSGLMLQPASIADSRYRFDMVFFGTNFLVSNNYLAFRREAFYNPGRWDEDNFKEKYVFENLNGKDKSGIINIGMILPSFMVNLNEKSALAFTTRIRGFSNVDNITEDFAKLAYEDFNYEPLLYKNLTNANFSIQVNYWAEFGVTFARVIANTGKHFFKGGATFKYLQGIASGYGFVSELSYRFDGSDTLSLFQSKVNYGLSSNFEEDGIKPLKAVSDPGFGLDIGFVYEYRPGIEKYRYNMDGQEGLLRPDKDKYMLRVGVSLLDLGRINYKKGYYSQDFVADIRDLDLTGLDINSIQDFNDTISALFNFSDNIDQNFLMRLPSVLSIQIDYNFAKNLYLNFSPYIALKKGTQITTKSHHFSTYNLTPRYDRRWFGVALPMQADEFGLFRVGIGLRLGPVWIGSNSIISNAFSDKIYGTDAYIMFKIPVFKSIKRDHDRDGVSNKLDRCPEIPGTWIMLGCPDADGDGIADQKDECPADPGPEILNGCPDRDKDGVADKNDRCPDHAGKPEFNGCPDTDNDGITDFEDECPDLPGLPALKGCPDRDMDGIADKDDKCPEIAGKQEFMGCPFADTDNDGISDENDQCPAIPGPARYNGCPDTDSDGIPDPSDLCPNTPGIPENNGCPAIKKEEIEIIDRAFSDLEFESGKSIIKTGSFQSLNELAELMINRKMWKVTLAGHTDNTGNPEKNMELSKNRTQAVKDYLIKQGVEEFRIKAEWYGQERPVADNKTPAGRQKNRRVEMKITFD